MGDTMATDASVKPALLSRTDELADGGTDPPVWLAELIGAVHGGDIGEGSGSASARWRCQFYLSKAPCWSTPTPLTGARRSEEVVQDFGR